MDICYIHGNLTVRNRTSENTDDNFDYSSRTLFYIIVILYILLIFVKNEKLFHITSAQITPMLLFLASVITLPLFMIPLILFKIWKQLVNIYLSIKYGDMYGGMLYSGDAIWAIENESKTIINVLLIVNYNKSKNVKDFVANVMKNVDKKIFNNINDQYMKLTSVRKSSLGFYFLLKNQVTIKDAVTIIDIDTNDEYLDQSVLTDILSQFSNKNLPKYNTALWELLLFSKPIRWTTDNVNTYQFPMLLRLSHVVGDGLSLVKFFSKTFADTHNIQAPNCFGNLTKPPGKSSTFLHGLCNFFNSLYIILVSPMVLVDQNFLRKEDHNSLHGVKLKGDKIAVYKVESKGELLAKVKYIKRKQRETTFTQILLTAISASLCQYFQRSSSKIPVFVTAGIPAIMSIPSLDDQTLLQNQFSIALLDLPILVHPKTMISRLQCVGKFLNSLKKRPDYKVYHLLLTKLCGIIPSPILKQSLKADKLTMVISNVPGVQTVSAFNGCVIEDVVFFGPNRGTAGVTFSILTYDDRFQLGLVIDRAIISSTREAQSLIDHVFIHIQKLYEEICFGDNLSKKQIRLKTECTEK